MARVGQIQSGGFEAGHIQESYLGFTDIIYEKSVLMQFDIAGGLKRYNVTVLNV